jgi:lysophospholipase L1-like esterase
VTERRFARFAALRVSLLGCCLAAAAIAVTSCAHSAGGAGAAPGSGSAAAQAAAVGRQDQPGGRAHAVRMVSLREQFAACEQRMEHSRGFLPAMAVVGASYTAGVGPGKPSQSWAADLARNLRWDAVIYGDPGAGYTRSGSGDLGPMTALLSAERLPALNPSLVIVQAGYDDGLVPPALERQQVERTIELIRAQAPDALIGLVTVFTSPARPIPGRFYQVDSTIVAAARAVDPNVIIMDPLRGQWTYQHADHDRGLHPTAAGDAWIARKVALILRSRGIDGRAAATGAAAPVVCTLGVRDGGTGAGI